MAKDNPKIFETYTIRLKPTKEEILGEIGELRIKIATCEQQARLASYQIELYHKQLREGNYYK